MSKRILELVAQLHSTAAELVEEIGNTDTKAMIDFAVVTGVNGDIRITGAETVNVTFLLAAAAADLADQEEKSAVIH